MCSITSWPELADIGAKLSEARLPAREPEQREAPDSERTESPPQFVFRGALRAHDMLRTTLDRCAQRVDWRGKRQELEDGLLHEFQRRAHHYTSDLPPRDASLEWLALMRHHGAPTRLLDWSYSFWVALFFAIEDACAGDDRMATVWALDRQLVYRCHAHLLSPEEQGLRHEDTHTEDPGTFARFYRRERSLVLFENPYRLNARLALQQGLFAVNANVESTFEEDLVSMYEAARARSPKAFLRDAQQPLMHRVDIPHSVTGRIVRELHRMNISRTTLFPGLDGFAQSLENLAFERHRLQEDP